METYKGTSLQNKSLPSGILTLHLLSPIFSVICAKKKKKSFLVCVLCIFDSVRRFWFRVLWLRVSGFSFISNPQLKTTP